ncbi:hypothetical protein A0O21_06295 [Streptococcus pantholopis]|uniref:[Citrate [pro-3S]-lyase] ligase n=2 Tax=Streptococcus pantholopis TaxID=1811193 RepID=A0A172Q847_9STRE|nr:hypothetical protein A0O21_06295 [Streptococcus pantholopis]
MSMLVERLWVQQQPNVKKNWLNLLKANGIREEDTIDAVYGIYDGDKLIATGSIFDNVIKCVAVDRLHTGGTVISSLVSHLESLIFETFESCYLYTKPDASLSFEHLGFRELARVPNKLVFMEKAVRGLDSYLADLKMKRILGPTKGAIVMNANPFTKGHLYLVEQAVKAVDSLYLFVVSQDRSDVSFKDRFALVQAGVAHLEQVKVVETGPYMVSTATFPSYFLSEEENVARIQANLDAQLFKRHIVPALDLTHRFLGTEPKSPVTAIYNQELHKVLSPVMELIVIERIAQDGEVISASRVRELWRKGELAQIEPLVPPSTYQYIKQKIERTCSL